MSQSASLTVVSKAILISTFILIISLIEIILVIVVNPIV